MAADTSASDENSQIIGVLGLGNWGTALANHLAAKGMPVLGWSLDLAVVKSINEQHRNSRFLTDVTLHSGLRATDDLARVAACKVWVIALPSAALDEVMPKLKPSPGTLIISGIKGLEQGSSLTPLQYFERQFGASVDLAVLSGPSFALDLVRHRPLGIVAASRSEECARRVAELFAGEWMKVYISTDPLGVELGGVVKNIVALAAGVCDGLELGESARAGLITRGLAEMTRLAVAMGAQQQTMFGLSGLGDLAMTATSSTSRNRTVGYRLGKGEALSTIIETLGSCAECITTAPLVLELGKKYKVELPIVEAAAFLLSGKVTARDMVKVLLSRPIKREF